MLATTLKIMNDFFAILYVDRAWPKEEGIRPDSYSGYKKKKITNFKDPIFNVFPITLTF